jgi:hypothetical protein
MGVFRDVLLLTFILPGLYMHLQNYLKARALSQIPSHAPDHPHP